MMVNGNIQMSATHSYSANNALAWHRAGLWTSWHHQVEDDAVWYQSNSIAGDAQQYCNRLHHICANACRKVERTLDIDVNLRDKFGRTALMWAAEQGHVAAIETLLDLGADRTIRDSHTNRSAKCTKDASLSCLSLPLQCPSSCLRKERNSAWMASCRSCADERLIPTPPTFAMLCLSCR